MISRSKALSMYKRILRVGQNWTATNPDNTQVSKDTGKNFMLLTTFKPKFHYITYLVRILLVYDIQILG